MMVHSPLEDVYDPSLIYIHWDLSEPSGGFVVASSLFVCRILFPSVGIMVI